MSTPIELPIMPREPRFQHWFILAKFGKRGRVLKGFHAKQKPVHFDYAGESVEGRVRARELRWTLRQELGREPTPREYRGAKKAARRDRLAAA